MTASDLGTFWLAVMAQTFFMHVEHTVLLSQCTTLFLPVITATTAGVHKQRLSLTLAPPAWTRVLQLSAWAPA